MANPLLYGQYAQPVRSIDEVQNALAQRDINALHLQSGLLDMQQRQQQQQQENALRQAVMQSNGDPTALRQALVTGGHADAVMKFDKSQADLGKVAAETDEKKTDTALKKAQVFHENSKALAREWSSIDPNNDEAMVQMYANAQKRGLISTEDAVAEINEAPPPNTPARAKWVAGQQARAVEIIDQQKQALEQAKAGEAVREHDLQRQTSLETNALTNKTHLQAAGIAASTSRANNRDTLAKDFKIAGIDPQTGNFADGGAAGGGSLVEMVGTGKMDLKTALARTPPAQKERFAQELTNRYPDFDPAALATRTAAAKAFTTGKEAQLLRSIGTANKHLSMLGGLVDALDNGDMQIVNRAKNAYREQTGQEAPSNFEAAKDIVGQEVVKSIVVNGGSMTERTAAAEAISKAKSAAQLKGVIKTYTTIMAAQRESLLQQREAAGLPASTIPDYTERAPSSGVPADIADILKKHGGRPAVRP